LILKPRYGGRFQNPLLAYWQRSELPVGIRRYSDLESHATALALFMWIQGS
jgi:hypothetical protein